jgi:hypothetical protein
MKTCTVCKIEKELNLFNKNKNKKDGLNSFCKTCRKKYDILNKDRIKQKGKEWRDQNPNKVKENNIKSLGKYKYNLTDYKKEWNKLNPEKLKQYREKYLNNLDINERKKYSQTYYRLNSKNLKEKRINNYHNNPIFKISTLIRNSINRTFKRGGYSKNSSTLEIIGCSFEEFKSYLESKFEPWMNWENQGKYNGELNFGWDLDHITPIKISKSKEEVILLNHYTNLQPLCSKINRDIKRDLLDF